MQRIGDQMQRRARILLSILLSILIVGVGTYYLRHRNSAFEATSRAGASVEVFSYYIQPDDWKREAEAVDVVVQGVIQEVLPSAWTTPDGKPATESEWMNNDTYQIRTPARLAVERVFKGSNIDDSLTFDFAGGKVGGITVAAGEDGNPYKVGARVILLLRKSEPGSPSDRVNPSGFYPVASLVIEGNTARGPQKNAPLPEVVRQLLQVQP